MSSNSTELNKGLIGLIMLIGSVVWAFYSVLTWTIDSVELSPALFVSFTVGFISLFLLMANTNHSGCSGGKK